MNLIYKKPLIVAIAAAIGTLIPFTGAMAAKAIRPVPATGEFTGAGAVEPAKLPLEAKESATSYSSVYLDGVGATTPTVGAQSGDLEAYIYTVPNYPVSANKNLAVKVTLTNGAKFKVIPKLICPSTGNFDSLNGLGVSGAEWAQVTAAAKVTAANTTIAKTAYYLNPLSTGNMGALTFEFPQGFTIPSVGSGACLLSYTAGIAGVGLSAYDAVLQGGAAGSDINASVEVTYQDVFASVTKTSTVPLVKFVTAYAATVTPPDNSVTIDVATESKKFILDGSSMTILSGGTITISTTTTNLRNATGGVVSASTLFSSATLTFEGNPASTLGSITLGTAACNDVFGTPIGTPTTTSGGGGSITVSLPVGTDNAFDAMARTAAGSTALLVCLNADGTKIMTDGQLSVTINGITVGGAVVEIGKTDLVNVGRNGTVLRVLNIPNSSGADRGFIRFYNTSSQSVVVTGTLYGQDGKVIGTSGAKLFDPLLPNDVKVLDSAGLMTKVGATTAWTGRAWLMVQAPVSSDLFRVQSLVRSPNGTLINVSADATD